MTAVFVRDAASAASIRRSAFPAAGWPASAASRRTARGFPPRRGDADVSTRIPAEERCGWRAPGNGVPRPQTDQAPVILPPCHGRRKRCARQRHRTRAWIMAICEIASSCADRRLLRDRIGDGWRTDVVFMPSGRSGSAQPAEAPPKHLLQALKTESLTASCSLTNLRKRERRTDAPLRWLPGTPPGAERPSTARSPGSRILAAPRLPGTNQWPCGARLPGHSCGGSPGHCPL